MRIRNYLLCVLLVGLAAAVTRGQTPIRPQDYEGVKQKFPKTKAPPAELPEPEVSVPDDDQTLIENLQGVVFVASQDDVQKEAQADGIEVKGLPLLDSDDFRSRIQPYLGNPVSWKTIGEMVKTTILYYRSQNRPVVDVIVPPQEITKGTIQLLVVEGNVGDVKVTGNEWFTSEYIKAQVELNQGDPIYAQKLLREVNGLNENPFLYVRPVLSPGATPGKTDVTLETIDRMPARFYLGYEKTGSRITRLGRYLAGINYGNLWNKGHEIGYQFATNPQFDDIWVHTAYYRIPMPNGQRWSFYGVFANYDAEHNDIHIQGQTWQLSTRYNIPLPSIGAYSHEIRPGFDFKRAENDLYSGGTTVYDNAVDTTQFVLEYAGTMPDDYGQTSFTAMGFFSPGCLSSKSDPSDYEQARAGADPAYLYGYLNLERIWNLPEDFKFVNRVVGQLSTDRLLGNEQLGFGGYNTLRGFDQREVNADEGLILTLEIQGPKWNLGRFEEDPRLQNTLQLLAFWDYAFTYNRGDFPGEDKSMDLMSAGVGLRYSLGRHVSLRVDYGFRLQEPAQRYTEFQNDNCGRLHFGLIVSY